jgi:hypothetical protein
VNLQQLANLADLFLGDGRVHEEVLVLAEDGELSRILSLNWDSANGHFVLCTENDVEEA